jgi:hypothetical protein
MEVTARVQGGAQSRSGLAAEIGSFSLRRGLIKSTPYSLLRTKLQLIEDSVKEIS